MYKYKPSNAEWAEYQKNKDARILLQNKLNCCEEFSLSGLSVAVQDLIWLSRIINNSTIIILQVNSHIFPLQQGAKHPLVLLAASLPASLEVLSIQNNMLGPSQVVEIIDAMPKSISCLYLNNNNLQIGGYTVVAKALEKHIKQLYLDGICFCANDASIINRLNPWQNFERFSIKDTGKYLNALQPPQREPLHPPMGTITEKKQHILNQYQRLIAQSKSFGTMPINMAKELQEEQALCELQNILAKF